MELVTDDECDEIIEAAIAAYAATHHIKQKDLVTDIRQRPDLGREIVRQAALAIFRSTGSADAAYRVWPDGTVQSTEDGQPHQWMSDDFLVVSASSEEEALAKARSC